jgi:hypothetical protein
VLKDHSFRCARAADTLAPRSQYDITHVTKVRDNPHDLLSHRSRSAADMMKAFNVHTVANGYNCGREYCFRITNEAEFDDWIATLSKLSQSAAKKHANRTRLEAYRVRHRPAVKRAL